MGFDTNTREGIADALAAAARLGWTDQICGARSRTGRELASLLCQKWRMGHERALRAAYTAGRFAQECSEVTP